MSINFVNINPTKSDYKAKLRGSVNVNGKGTRGNPCFIRHLEVSVFFSRDSDLTTTNVSPFVRSFVRQWTNCKNIFKSILITKGRLQKKNVQIL